MFRLKRRKRSREAGLGIKAYWKRSTKMDGGLVCGQGGQEMRAGDSNGQVMVCIVIENMYLLGSKFTN